MTLEEAFEKALRNGADQDAWEVLYEYFQPRLLAYVSSLLITFSIYDADSARDIVHEAILALVYQWKRTRFESVKSVEGYLRVTCRHMLIDQYRHRQVADQFIAFLDTHFSGVFGGDVQLYRSIFLDQILLGLGPECQALLKTFVVEDLSPAEIAEREGASPAKFYTRWYRCIQKAKQVLAKTNAAWGR